ncbi:hypothetical protein D039_0920B, partial [Vibrio parahaemolyticus EKP-028]
RAFRVLLVSR